MSIQSTAANIEFNALRATYDKLCAASYAHAESVLALETDATRRANIEDAMKGFKEIVHGTNFLLDLDTEDVAFVSALIENVPVFA